MSHNILSKRTILCWATFIGVLSHVQPAGPRLDIPARETHVLLPFFSGNGNNYNNSSNDILNNYNTYL